MRSIDSSVDAFAGFIASLCVRWGWEGMRFHPWGLAAFLIVSCSAVRSAEEGAEYAGKLGLPQLAYH